MVARMGFFEEKLWVTAKYSTKPMSPVGNVQIRSSDGKLRTATTQKNMKTMTETLVFPTKPLGNFTFPSQSIIMELNPIRK